MERVIVGSRGVMRRVRQARQVSWARRLPRRLKVGALLLVVLVLAAAAGPPVFGLNPYKMDPNAILQGPTLAFPFGTDDYGRSILARVLFGARTSFEIAAVVCACTSVVGLVLATASVLVGPVDGVVMRLVDGLMALPAVVMALALVTIVGAGFGEVVIVESLFFLPWSIRIMRSSMLSVEHRAYVEAAVSQGATGRWVVRRHILPNAAGPVVVEQVLIFGYAILAEAVLSFLGVGIEAPAASLGNMLSEAQPLMLQDPLFSVFPGVIIGLVVFGVNVLADGVAENLNVVRAGLGVSVGSGGLGVGGASSQAVE